MIVAAAARLAVAVYADAHPQRFDFPDSRRYVLLAVNIAAGRGAIESPHDRTGTDPLYSYLLAPALLGRDADPADALNWFSDWQAEPLESRPWVRQVYRWARLLNVAFGVAGVAAARAIARRLGGDVAGLAAGWIAALDPISIYFCGLVLTESAYVGLLWCAILLLMRARQESRTNLAAAAGLLLGAAALIRSAGLLLGFALPLIAMLGTDGASRVSSASGARRRRIGMALAAAAATAAVIAPQTIRNYRLLGRFVPVHTSLGATLLDSLGPWADGGPGMQYIEWPPTPPQADEYERDRCYRAWVADWARAHPRDVLRLAWSKLRRTWSITMNAPGYESALYTAVGWLTVAPVFGLAAVGAWRMRRRGLLLLLILAPAIYVTALHAIFVGSVRYRLPAMPGLFVLAGVAVATFVRPGDRANISPSLASNA